MSGGPVLAEVAALAHGIRPLTASDLPAVAEWLRRPHLREWWGDPEREFRQIEESLADPRMEYVALLLHGRPVGFGQTWSPHDWEGHPLAGEPPGARGIDLSIGEEALLGRGHGRRFAKLLAGHCLAAGAPRVLIDPAPTNLRAIRAYAAAGFRPVGELVTVSGPALLMMLEADHPLRDRHEIVAGSAKVQRGKSVPRDDPVSMNGNVVVETLDGL